MGTTTTPNLGLIKPDGNEPGSNFPTQHGSNMDKIDSSIGDLSHADLESKTAESLTDQNISTTAAQYQTVGFSFVAPPSGKGLLVMGADVSEDAVGGGGLARIWPEIRNGGTVGSGTVAFDGDQEPRRLSVQGNGASVARISAGISSLVTGLTPGNTYNTSMRAQTSGNTGVVRAGRIAWIPLTA